MIFLQNGDLDNDGDLDLVVNNVNQKAFAYKNNSRELNKNNFIGVLLKGKGKNTFAIGSLIKIYTGNQIMSREIMPSRGFQSSVDYKTIIGLGNKKPDSMIVIWPDLSVTKINHPPIDTVLIIKQQDVPSIKLNNVSDTASINVKAVLTPVKQNFDKHKEDDYIDFYTDRLIPMMVSKEGPKAAIGDVNGDGLLDIFIGGAANEPGQLYIQTPEGFTKKDEPDFTKYAAFEDIACTFFDCDGDGDLDLFVGSGGNNHSPGSVEFENRLYRSDGKGNFELDSKAFPRSGMNNAVVIAADFDKDGDTDLFVGSRSVPENYGPSPASYIYINDGKGHFTDIAKTKNKDIENIGLVTGAVWADVTGDKKEDLVITGEWMTPHVFTFEGDHFVEVKTNLDNLFGWWQTIAAADINGDGKTDLILGNIGENFYLRPNFDSPVKMWIGDLDNNGTTDKIITRTVNGKDVTVFLKKDITDQITSLRKENLRYGDFAKKSIQELFPENILQQTDTKIFNYPASCIAINKGNGKFEVKTLPQMVQFSSVNAILCTDVNNDGKTDLILGGNKFDFQPQFGRLDASFGTILINDGEGNFTPLDPSKSGLQLTGQIRDVKEIKNKEGTYILILQNNEYPLLYKLNNN